MTLPRSQSVRWPVHHVIELAADLAEVAIPWIESSSAVPDELLFELWDQGRQLTADWQRRLELLENATPRMVSLDLDLLLEMLAREMMAIEIPTRLLATILAALDRQRQRPECRPIIEHVLFSIQHLRLRLLTLVLQGDDRHASIDRFRRRCERWTDLLLGMCVVRFGTAAFTHDSRRSWEFGEDLLSDVGLDISQTFVRPSLLAAFRGTDGKSPIQSPNAAVFLRSMVSLVPSTLATSRLQRWQGDTHEAGAIANDVEMENVASDGGNEGWLLLDRCLRLVEWRRRHGK